MSRKFRKIFGCPTVDIIPKKKSPVNKNKEKHRSMALEEEIEIFEEESNCAASMKTDSYSNDPDIDLMRKTIKRNPEIFILNNLMMCVQFFENYDEEIEQVRKTLVPIRETEYNQELLPQKRALVPDALQEHIARNIKFTAMRETVRPTIGPLQPIRIYIIHENFEVTEDNNPHHYSTMNDTVTYSLRLVPSENSGYVYLQHLNVTPSKKISNKGELTSIAENSDELYGVSTYSERQSLEKSFSKSYATRSLPDLNFDERLHSKSMKSPQFRTARSRFNNSSPTSSISSGYVTNGVDNDSDYGYNGNKSFSEVLKNSELPKTCFKMLTCTLDGKIYDPADEHKKLDSKLRRIREKLDRYNYNIWYINSTAFMRYFYKVFLEQISKSLRIDEETVDYAKRYRSVIYCEKINIVEYRSYDRIVPYEIIPSIWAQWPDCADEWLERPRNTWPDVEVIKKIKEFGCYIIPECSVSKQNSNRKIEWQITFPAAERYLETCMSHAQTQVLLVALMLHKIFLRPIHPFLTTSHIRNKLFWLIEQDDKVLNWPEHRTGERLLNMLSSLHQSISDNIPQLKDYFLKNKNLLQNVPSEYLLQSQKQLKRILDNPVMYVLHATENVRYKQRFFPRLDYEELFKILTDDIMTIIHPQLAEENLFKENSSIYVDTGFWDNFTKTKTSRKTVINKMLINFFSVINNITDISIRCAELDDTRLGVLLDFFIRHFIQIAQRYHQYGSIKSKTLYIKHIERLCVLLAEKEGYHEQVSRYRQKIHTLKNLVTRSHSQCEPPETPKRNIDQQFFNRPLKDRFSDISIEQQFLLPNVSEAHESGCGSSETNGDHVQSNVKVTTAMIHENNMINTGEKYKEVAETMLLRAPQKKKGEGIRTISITKTEENSESFETTRI